MTDTQYQELIEFLAAKFDRVSEEFRRVHTRLDAAEERLSVVEQRLSLVERRLSPTELGLESLRVDETFANLSQRMRVVEERP